MSDRRSYMALDWVTDEIVETLSQAMDALDCFVSNQEDVTKLRFCLTYVHQVSGSLVMVELHGASILAREIEGLVSSLLEEQLHQKDKAGRADLIKKGLNELSAYIVRVRQTHQDAPKELLGILNEVREANQQEKMSDSDVFAPDLALARQANPQKPSIAVAEFNDLIRKLRQTFQKGLIGVVRDQALESNYLLMAKVCGTLKKVSVNTSSEPLWKMAYAITEYLYQAKAPADLEAKKALKQIDHQIKHLEECGRDALQEPPLPSVLSILLYIVATVDPITNAIKQLRKDYHLDEALIEQNAEKPDIADKLLLAIRGSIQHDVDALLLANKKQDKKGLSTGLSRILATFELLSLKDRLPVLDKTAKAVRSRILAGEEIPDTQDVVLALAESDEIAKTLLDVVQNKAGFVAGYKHYIEEIRQGLDSIKESIANLVAEQSEDEEGRDLPSLLNEQIRKLNISPFRELVPILEAAKKYILEKLPTEIHSADSTAVESLADVLSSIDYYLECVMGESEENLAAIIGVARESISGLDISYEAGMIDEPEVIELKAVEEAETEKESSLLEMHTGPAEESPLLDLGDSLGREPEIEDDIFVLGDDVDEEILEIFIEEGREVVGHILEYLPQLKSNYENEEALLEVRRSFHTLKGSGRMVGAMPLGDFAWSVERMLNKVRDGLAKVTANCIAIVEEASALVPSVLDLLEENHSINKSQLAPLILKADAEWEGKPVAALQATIQPKPVSAPEPVSSSEAVEEHIEEELEITPPEEAVEIIDEELLSIFIAEAETHIAAFCEFLDQIDPGYEDVHVTSELQRALHTLKGSAHMAGVTGMANLVTPLESFVKDLNNFQTRVDAEILAILMRAAELLQAQLTLLKNQSSERVAGVDSFIAELKLLHAKRIETQEEQTIESEGLADKYTALLSEALECMTESAGLISEWQSEGLDHTRQEALVNYVLRLSQTASRANYKEVAELALALANFYKRAIDSQDNFDSDFFALANKGHDELDDMMDIIAAQQVVEPASELIGELGRGAHPAAQIEAKPASAPASIVSAKDIHLPEFRQQLAGADKEMLEIFSEEAGELMEVLDVLIHDWIKDHSDTSSLGEIKRVLHTIKGGARLTELGVLGNLAHEYEGLIEQAEADNRFDGSFFAKIARYQNHLVSLVEYAISGKLPHGYAEPLSEAAHVTEAAPVEKTEIEKTVAEETISEEISAGIPAAEVFESVEMPHMSEPDDLHDAEPISEPMLQVAALQPDGLSASLALLAEQYRHADQETLEIFVEEIDELASSLEETARSWIGNHEGVGYAAELKRVLHTIKGGARMAELAVLGDLAHDYESVIEAAESRSLFDESFFERVQSCQDKMNRVIDFIMSGADPDSIPAQAIIEKPVEISQKTILATSPVVPDITPAQPFSQVSQEEEFEQAGEEIDTTPLAAPANIALLILADQYRKADPDTLEIFLEEVGELSGALEESVGEWLDNHNETHRAAELKRILHTIKGSARMTELGVLGDLAHDFESMIEAAEAKKMFDDEFFGRVQSFQDQVHQMAEFIMSGANAGRIPAAPASAAIPAVSSLPDARIAAPASAKQPQQDEVVVELSDDIDSELVELFVEEAKEQVEGIEECIASFLRDKTSIEPLEELKRLLHTLKGGARLAGVRIVGDLSHDFETFIINSEREKTTGNDAFIDEMQAFHEKLGKNINAIKVSSVPKPAGKKAESNVVPIRPGIDPTGVSQAAIDATRNFIDNFNKEQQRSNKEPVKISPEQLQSLINLAGESSIGRSRIEEQISELIFSQEEMEGTVDRLHAQLRRLEIETEAQIVFRQEQVVSEGQENFDPLEMDRYTQMQQLSKSLIESASDLDDISATFTNKMRDLETLLVQQARINTELQESLMRCQMVPFSRMVPRLRRIVRQVAQELGKRIEFDVENAEGELDRSILERMVAPLEHMLRNAVDHGIEMPDVRIKAGKNPQGMIILVLSREGGEVVLKLKDDGGGINVKAVRKKAIERGLITEDTRLSDHEISQFIMHAGFSTAEKVTQISGRGVGMDVVHSEIKQMGGSLDMQSVQGQGSEFTVRLPFTVSVNRALMVCIGSDTYAIPLNTIEGIVRVSPYELEAYYQPDSPMFEYAGQSYNLRYMGTLLHHGHSAKLEGLTTPLPVVLIRSSDYSVAVQVDRLLGSREVVVKSLGPQFGMVDGLSGATVLGDGSVVIILDMLALIRSDALKGLASVGAAIESYEPEVEKKATTVMVTDDSVTVRKVTSRLLERFGMKVILAKDGLDAITQLLDMEPADLPDIMLLDIEMPRMDGFEVLSRVRHNDKLQHIPICMITSRTGEKHRERAISLGASRYLGKPFQERELLQTISELTGAEVQQA